MVAKKSDTSVVANFEELTNIANANQIIKEKETAIEELKAEELKITEVVEQLWIKLETLEKNKEALEIENKELFEKVQTNKSILDKKDADKSEELSTLEATLLEKQTELEAKELELATKEQEINSKFNKLELVKIEANNLEEQNKSKEQDLKVHADQRKFELDEIKKETQELKTEQKKLAELKTKIEEANAQCNKEMKNLNEAKKSMESISATYAEQTLVLENKKTEINDLRQSAEFLVSQWMHIVTSIRQALTSYVQIAWLEVKIPELDEKTLDLVAKIISPNSFELTEWEKAIINQ